MNAPEPTWAPGKTGTSFGVSVATTAASAATQIRPPEQAGFAVDIMLKASISAAAASQVSGFAIVFGDSAIADPVDTDMLIDQLDGWVKVRIPAGVTHYKIKSPAAGGAAGGVRGYVCGRPAGV
jgi:hypothetical protein